MGSLDGQQAIVTGGGSGIGAAIVRGHGGARGPGWRCSTSSAERAQAVADEIGGVAVRR